MEKNININSSDEERTNILKNKELKIVEWDKSKELVITDSNESTWHALKRYIKENNILNKEIVFSDFDIPIDFTINTLKESVHQMTKRNSNIINLAKLLSVIDQVCLSAVKIETEKYRHIEKMHFDTKQVHHLLSAFIDDEYIYPVKITINEKKIGRKYQFYMVITAEKLKLTKKIKEALTNTRVHSEEESVSDGVTSFTINISEFVKFFNRNEGIIIKNLPDGLLNQKQIEIKKKIKDHDAAIEKNFVNMLFSKVL